MLLLALERGVCEFWKLRCFTTQQEPYPGRSLTFHFPFFGFPLCNKNLELCLEITSFDSQEVEVGIILLDLMT